MLSQLKESIFLDEKKYVYFNREINKIIHTIKNLSNSIPQVFFLINLQENLEFYIYEHSIKSSLLAALLGRAINLPEKSLDLLIKASILKDIGTLRIPQNIITKNDKLKAEEFEEIKKHPLHSFAIISDYEHMETAVCEFVLTHHEREDGSGYPLGLFSKDIPLESKIIAISDSFSAMTSNRFYAKRLAPFLVLEDFYSNSLDKLHMNLVLKLMKLYSLYSLEQNVLLNNGMEATVIQFEKDEFIRPIVKLKDGTFINLKETAHLFVEEIIF